MCLDLDCDGDADTCFICFPLMCLLGYCCCCKDCDRNNRNPPPQVGYVVPGSGYAYPTGPGPFPTHSNYYPGSQQGYPFQPGYPQQGGYVCQPGYNPYNPPPYTQAYGNQMKSQPGSTIVSYVQ